MTEPMSGEQHEPTTADIEAAWMAEVANEPSDAGHGKVLHRERQHAFDRWLSRNKADVLRDAALSGLFGTAAQSRLLYLANDAEAGQ